jgi:hypothetical protein
MATNRSRGREVASFFPSVGLDENVLEGRRCRYVSTEGQHNTELLRGRQLPLANVSTSHGRCSRNRRRSLIGRGLVVATIAAALGVPALDSSPAYASAAPLGVVKDCPTYDATFGTNVISVTFHYQPVPQTWVVPSTAVPDSVCIDASGAQGGPSAAQSGGTGGTVNVVTALTPGQATIITVGKRGRSGGGGTGAGRGGSGTYVFAPDGSVLVAAGGGGGATAAGGAADCAVYSWAARRNFFTWTAFIANSFFKSPSSN